MKKLVKKQAIMFSIVLCTYNREKHIEQCLESLMNQNFPEDKYEIIVVDDGSTDSTIQLASKYPVTLIKHEKNKGVAAARNTGLDAARGQVYICFDDDCTADKNWLKNLAIIYKKYGLKNIVGVAGFIKLIGEGGIIEKYMDETGYGNPSPVSYVTSNSLLARFFAYVKNMFSPAIKSDKKILEVGEIWGANCSFPIPVLKKINGWDEKLSGVEDTDLCDRIKKTFPGKKFICNKEAVIYHDHRLSLNDLLLKPYNRGLAILKFYLQNAKIPPIFPFPVIIVFSLLLTIFIIPAYAILTVLILPLLLYSWWVVKAITKNKLHFLLFPYLQSSYELFSVLGLAKGYLSKKI